MIYTVTLNPALDKTVEIESFTPDAVNRAEILRIDAGGKGINVSKVIKKLGEESVALGVLGGNNGKIILDLLNDFGLKTDFTFANGETRTNLKIVDRVKNTNTDINESGFYVDKAAIDEILSGLLSRLNIGDIVILAGSLPKGLSSDTYAKWITSCKEIGAKVFLDADGECLLNGIKAVPYLIKPNIDELSRITGKIFNSIEEIKAAAQSFTEKGIQKVVVSLGGDGALFITENESVFAKGITVEVKSTVGAGDSMVAALAVAQERNLNLKEASALAVAAATAKVMCEGTMPPEYSQVIEILNKVKLYNI